MIKKLLVTVVVLFSIPMLAQEGNTSPYSFYGIGTKSFSGTMENQAMGGMSILGDSIHLNLQNPAAYGSLLLTNFTLGASHKEVTQETSQGEGSVASTTFDYLALGFPIAKNMGAGFGLIPATSVDYDVVIENDETYEMYTGRGGMNKAFVSYGYEFIEGFRLGITGSYNFGSITNTTIQDDSTISYGVREINDSNLSGFSFDLGAQYEKKLANGMRLYGSASYTPESSLTSENSRDLETVIVSREDNAVVSIVDSENFEVNDDELKLPSELKIGAGIGRKNNWFAGAEYGNTQASSLANRSFSNQEATYVDASQLSLGGYWIPRYNSITSYWDRVAYRAGFRYEGTGLNINNQDINEFGISFGVGLPVGRSGSNANLFFEYGQRGTTDNGLVKEDFFKVGLSLSLNAKWFVPFKFN